MNPLVSIGIPNYNTGPFLREACESIVNQTYSNFEVIVTDDCSTDDSFSRAKSINDSRFQFIPGTKNRGPQAQRNDQIQLARGKYFCVFDADDTWHPLKIQLQVEFMERHPHIFALGTALNKGTTPFIDSNPILRKSEIDAELKTQLFWETPIWNNSLMFHIETAKKHDIGYTEGEWAEDQTFLLDAARKNLQFSNLQENLTFYRTHETQMSGMPDRLMKSAFRQRMAHGAFYFADFSLDEWKLLLLNPEYSPNLFASYDSADHSLKIQLFRRLMKMCQEETCVFPYRNQLQKRCEVSIYTLLMHSILNRKKRFFAVMQNLDVFSQLLLRKIRAIFNQIRR